MMARSMCGSDACRFLRRGPSRPEPARLRTEGRVPSLLLGAAAFPVQFVRRGVPAPGPIRDHMAAADITVNGLCILHEEPDLLDSYTDEVIGGPGAFAVTCREYKDFTEAMRQKLVREIKGHEGGVWSVAWQVSVYPPVTWATMRVGCPS